ncbi:thioesterase family protein [Oxalobacteraceae bacterium OTU3CINTB1]|nr:thioesterase family protein [Oxalobacteraceae bacterium OTU3CINTB1]
MAYFTRLSDTNFLATEHIGGAWSVHEQHIAAPMGLLTHVIERDCARRGNGFKIGRLAFDILGVIPIEEVQTEVQSLRSGRTIELVEATLLHNGRPALRARAWLVKPNDTSAIAGHAIRQIPGPDTMPRWDPTTVWPGGFIATIDVHRASEEPGRAAYWARARQPLLADEPVSALARAASLFDIANGMAVRAAPTAVAFPNLDLTAHLFATPRGEWLGFDTSVSFGADGLGLTSSTIYDETGPIGTLAQILTIRPNIG